MLEVNVNGITFMYIGVYEYYRTIFVLLGLGLGLGLALSLQKSQLHVHVIEK